MLIYVCPLSLSLSLSPSCSHKTQTPTPNRKTKSVQRGTKNRFADEYENQQNICDATCGTRDEQVRESATDCILTDLDRAGTRDTTGDFESNLERCAVSGLSVINILSLFMILQTQRVYEAFDALSIGCDRSWNNDPIGRKSHACPLEPY